MSLDLRTRKPVWLLNALRVLRHKKLENNIRSEVVVVGGGISGALIAHRLTSLGMQVTIIDSRQIGAGSTAASTAILSYEADINLGDLIKKIGKCSAVRAYRAGIEAIDSIGDTIRTLDDPCDFKKRRSLYLASHGEMSNSWSMSAAWAIPEKMSPEPPRDYGEPNEPCLTQQFSDPCVLSIVRVIFTELSTIPVCNQTERQEIEKMSTPFDPEMAPSYLVDDVILHDAVNQRLASRAGNPHGRS